MRVEIDDWMRQRYTIDSGNAVTIGKWAAEQFSKLMTADARLQDCRIQVWPSSPEEAELIGQPPRYKFTQDDLLALAEVILEASKRLADKE